jgi:hypothetical protein
MGLAFANYREKACCLCGSVEKLTGEHKIKASTLRGEFGPEKLFIIPFDNMAISRSVQGPKSKEFHFKSGVCQTCNSERTQRADQEFSHCCEIAQKYIDLQGGPMAIFQDQRYKIGSPLYLNLHRYFAKLLCCHMADAGAPRSKRLSNFAIGKSDRNCVSLHIDRDSNQLNFSQADKGLPFASHGGLAVYTDKRTHTANAFHSTRSVGPLRFIFHTRLNWVERNELRFFHSKFRGALKKAIQSVVETPLTPEQNERLGL